MDADDEPAMAYFLPNGIADDSPPKQSRVKASFGPIGGRFAVSGGQSTATSPASPSGASAASNSRGDVDFGGLHTRPRPTLEPSPFGSSGGSASSPRPTNFLLSDLGGEIHTPRASRDFGDSGGTTPTASRPFGFPGAFGPGLSEGGAIGAGAIRSPTSMFDRGQEAAKSFSMQGESRNSLTSAGFGNESQQLYRGGTTNLSYLSSGEADSPFGSGSMRTWPAVATEVSQPRRMLQRPPGLAGPPGLSEPHAIDGIQPQMRLGSGGGDMMEQHVAGPQFNPFHPSASSPMAGTGESNRAFSRGDDQYGASLLSSLRLSSGVFGDSSLHDQGDVRGVSNRDLAELNTHSMAVSEMGGMRIRHAVDSPSVPWDNREPTTSRRIDIQARSKTPRSPKKSRDGRRKSEGRSDLRAKALEFSMDAINAFTPGSPMKPRRTDRGRKLASSINVDEALPPSADSSRSNSDKSAPRGKRRNQAADTGVASSFSSSSENDCRRRGPVGQNNESSSQYGLPPGFEAGDGPVKPAMQETSKLKRREENIVPSRTSASRRNSTRGNDKVAGTTRRQVYREKQVKENVKDVSLTKEVTPNRSQSRTAINIPQERRSSGDDEGLEVKKNLPKQNVLLSSMEGASSVTKPVDAIKATQSTDTSSQDAVTISNGAGVSISGNDNSDAGVDTSNRLSNDGVTSVPVVSDASDEASQEETATFYDRDSASSSEVLEDVCVAAREQRDPTDSPELDEVLSPLESSESETDRGQSATEDKLTSSTKPVADDNLPAPQSKSESSSAPAAAAEKKTTLKEHRKEKSKKDKGEKRKTARGKKDKRASSSISKTGDGLSGSANQDKILDDLAARGTPLSTQISQGLRKGCSAAAAAGLAAFVTMRRGCAWTASRLNVKGVLGTAFSYVESVLAVVFSVLLLLSLHAASWFIRIHRVAFRAILTHRHIGFCFAFLYGFPFLVQYVFPWAPPWAPVCLWYAFLVQLFCTNGPTAMVTTFRVILPLVFLVEGISHHSFLLDLNGAELLLTSFIISALKTSNLYSPIFFLSLATQCLLAVFLGSELIVQWLQLALALYSLHVMAATDDEWIGIGDEEDELSCHPLSMHHSIADYNHHPAPSTAVSIQKTKRLDRRALAYVRGRKLR